MQIWVFELQQPSADFWNTKPRHFWTLHRVTVRSATGSTKPKKGLSKAEAKNLLKWVDRENAA